MSNEHSTGVTPEEHALWMRSAEAREARQAEKRAALDVVLGGIPRGRKRPDVLFDLPPEPLGKDELITLGKRLSARGGKILRDQFSRSAHIFNDKTDYDSYAFGGGNARNKRPYRGPEVDPAEAEQAIMARDRQTLHVRDSLHGSIIDQLRMAWLFKAGIRQVRQAYKSGIEPSQEALRISASAIEDFGFALAEQSFIQKKTRNGPRMARNLQQTGQHAAEHPGILRIQRDELFLLVQREEERREEFYSEALSRYEQPDWGGNRRTPAQLEAIAQTQLVIDNLGSE